MTPSASPALIPNAIKADVTAGNLVPMPIPAAAAAAAAAVAVAVAVRILPVRVVQNRYFMRRGRAARDST